MTEKALLQAIADHPYDIAPRLAYADWLEERGDARAEEVRAACRYRLPISREETRHLSAVAAARESASADVVVRTVSPAAPGHPLVAGPTGLGALRDDLHHLAVLEVARNFPRDDKGRLQAGAVVL